MTTASAVTAPPAARRNQFADLREIFASGQVLNELVKRDLKARYKQSVIGVLWSMLNPLIMMLVTLVVFSQVFRFAIDNFPVYFLSAFLAWSTFQQGTAAASVSVVASAGLARRIYIPPALFPVASVNAAAVNLIVSLPPLFLIVALTGGPFTWALLFLPVALALLLLFTYGVALILSAAAVFFHDTIHLYSVALTPWMYLTPLFYPMDIIPPRWAFVIHLNPMTAIVELFRQPIYAGVVPDPATIGIAAAWAVGTALIGWLYFERTRDAFLSYI